MVNSSALTTACRDIADFTTALLATSTKRASSRYQLRQSAFFSYAAFFKLSRPNQRFLDDRSYFDRETSVLIAGETNESTEGAKTWIVDAETFNAFNEAPIELVSVTRGHCVALPTARIVPNRILISLNSTFRYFGPERVQRRDEIATKTNES